MHKIGVVGPASSVVRILEVAKEFEHQIEFVPLIYNDLTEIATIVQNGRAQMNGWFFSGLLPYTIAKNAVGLDENFAYCPSMGAGLYHCILQVAYHQQRILDRISIDSVESIDIEKWLQELGLPVRDVYIKKYSGFDPQEIIDFHIGLWQEGKIDGAITGANYIYNALKNAGVPAYHSTLTRMEIYQALLIIIEKVKSFYFKGSQVGLVIIEIEHYDEIIEKARTPYNLQHLELKIKQGLLPLCQQLNGYLVDKGNGIYEIFSSRGAVEQGISILQDTMAQLKNEMELMTAVGIGFGETVFSAEINTHKAVRNAKRVGGNDIVIVQDDGVMIEAVGQEKEIAYAYYSDDKELTNRLMEANIGIKTYKKIEAIIIRMGMNTFTAEKLADQMAVTVRNVQRIITSLCKVGLVEVIGEMNVAARGRPSRVYRLADKSRLSEGL